jgi:hypothetical protein
VMYYISWSTVIITWRLQIALSHLSRYRMDFTSPQ